MNIFPGLRELKPGDRIIFDERDVRHAAEEYYRRNEKMYHYQVGRIEMDKFLKKLEKVFHVESQYIIDQGRYLFRKNHA